MSCAQHIKPAKLKVTMDRKRKKLPVKCTGKNLPLWVRIRVQTENCSVG